MIVKLSGWIYVACGLLNLLYIADAGRAASARLAAMVGAFYILAAGIGLLLRARWGRWLALGMSVITWTLGGVGLLFLVAYMLNAAVKSNHFFPMFAATVIFGAILAALIVLNYKLFHHLISEEGKFEFDAPENESKVVLKSAGVYIALSIALAVLGSSRDRFWQQRSSSDDEFYAALAVAQERAQAERARARSNAAQANDDAERRARNERILGEQARASRERPENLAAATRFDAQASAEERRREMDRIRAETRADLEARRADLDRRMSETMRRSSRTSSGSARQTHEFPARVNVPPMTTKSGSDQILKCRDSAGSVSFTQGYCPAGTQQVESPNRE